MKHDTLVLMLILISSSEFCPFILYYYIFLLPFHIFSKLIFPPLSLRISPPGWHRDKTDHNHVPWSYSERCRKVYQHNWALLPCQKITGKSSGGRAGLTQISSPTGHGASEAADAGHPPEEGERQHLRWSPKLDLRFLKGNLTARGAGGTARPLALAPRWGSRWAPRNQGGFWAA